MGPKILINGCVNLAIISLRLDAKNLFLLLCPCRGSSCIVQSTWLPFSINLRVYCDPSQSLGSPWALALSLVSLTKELIYQLSTGWNFSTCLMPNICGFQLRDRPSDCLPLRAESIHKSWKSIINKKQFFESCKNTWPRGNTPGLIRDQFNCYFPEAACKTSFRSPYTEGLTFRTLLGLKDDNSWYHHRWLRD